VKTAVYCSRICIVGLLTSGREKWQLKFNPDKCKVMHVGHQHNTCYEMLDIGVAKLLEEVTKEKDLGVFVASDLKPST